MGLLLRPVWCSISFTIVCLYFSYQRKSKMAKAYRQYEFHVRLLQLSTDSIGLRYL